MKKLIFLLSFLFSVLSYQSSIAQWKQLNDLNREIITCIFVNDTDIYASTWEAGIFLSTDNGENWVNISNSMIDAHLIEGITINGTDVFVRIWKQGVFLSTDNGLNWKSLNNGLLSDKDVNSLAIIGKNIFAGTSEKGILLSTDKGTNWIEKNKGLTTTHVSSIAIKGTNIYAGTWNGLFLSTDNGENWIAKNNGLPNPADASLITFCEGNIFIKTSAGVYISEDNGENWNKINNGLSDSTNVMSLACSGINIFGGTGWSGGVFSTMYNGTNWNPVNDGLTNTPVVSLAIKDDYIYAGTAGAGIWKRPLSEIVGVKELGIKIDELGIKLCPNPANSLIVVSYSLIEKSIVKLSVYDVMGRKQLTIDNGQLIMENAGKHTMRFDVGELKSGLYFVKLSTENGSRVVKFIKN